VQQLGLCSELLWLEEELTRRFGRPPLPAELAGFAATRVEENPVAAPHLRRLYEIYQRHATDLGWDMDENDGPEVADPLDRFLAQVEQISLSTCTDACPACLAGRSPHGPLEVTKHLLSRRLLQAAHRLLTEEFTRPLAGADAADLGKLARERGWLILSGVQRADGSLSRTLRDAGMEQVGEFLEFRREGPPLLHGVWVGEEP
jgi:hypothetical protein